jgi:hypothetical protein
VPHQLSHAGFVERDHVIETLAPRRSHKSLDEWDFATGHAGP